MKLYLFSVLATVALLAGVVYVVDQKIDVLPDDGNLGGTNAIPTAVAFYEDALQSRISETATSFTLVRGTDDTGTLLASSTYGFVLSEGTTNEEIVIADCTGRTCTNVTRGISLLTGTTTVTTLRHEHRRGDSVKITNAPLLLILSRIMNGIGTVPNLLSYTSGTACATLSPNSTICDKAYIDGVAVAGASNANETTKGIVELATARETASSTILGSTAAGLVMQAQYATDTPKSGCATGFTSTAGAGCSVVALLTGKISQSWLDLSGTWTWNGLQTFTAGFISTASSTMATTTYYGYSINNQPVTAFTAGETITAGQPVTMTTTTTNVYRALATNASSTQFIGIAKTAATAGTTIYVQTDGVVTGLSGLTAGREYYSDNTATLSTATGTVEIYVGKALTTTSLQIDRSKMMQYNGSGSLSGNSTVTVPPYTRFITMTGNVSWAGAVGSGGINLALNGAMSGSVQASQCCALLTGSYTVTWTGPASTGFSSILTGAMSGSATGGSATAYYYR